MRGAAILALTVGPAALAACAPLPLADAERVCLEDARAATGPRGSLGMGVRGDRHGISPVTRLEVSVSSDYLMGRDPAAVYDACVQRRAGQPPSRPLYDQPGRAGR